MSLDATASSSSVPSLTLEAGPAARPSKTKQGVTMLSGLRIQSAGHEEDRLARLHEIIEERSLLTGERFRLASGGLSAVFFNMKATLLDPEGVNLAADAILERIQDKNADALGGLVIGACPIVDNVCAKSLGKRPLRFFYVRKEPKEWGTCRLIEGNLERGDNVVIVDDVTTEGNSVLRAVEAVEEFGCHVTEVITIVDRLQGAKEKLAKRGIHLTSLFTIRDFLD